MTFKYFFGFVPSSGISLIYLGVKRVFLQVVRTLDTLCVSLRHLHIVFLALVDLHFINDLKTISAGSGFLKGDLKLEVNLVQGGGAPQNLPPV